VIGGFAWPDAVIVLVLVVAAFKGFKRGFVAELGGVAALAAALIAPWYYNGAADAQIQIYTKLNAGQAHVAGMLLTAVFAYLVVLSVAGFLQRIAHLPILGTGNALAGAVVGFAKGAILIWIVLFVALLFPLTPAIRDSLRDARLAPYFTSFDDPAARAVESVVPSFLRPMLDPLIQRR
jgi:uncharacterized membrane protein required for colicin V production